MDLAAYGLGGERSLAHIDPPFQARVDDRGHGRGPAHDGPDMAKG